MTREERGKKYTTEELERNFDYATELKWVYLIFFVVTWILIYLTYTRLS